MFVSEKPRAHQRDIQRGVHLYFLAEQLIVIAVAACIAAAFWNSPKFPPSGLAAIDNADRDGGTTPDGLGQSVDDTSAAASRPARALGACAERSRLYERDLAESRTSRRKAVGREPLLFRPKAREDANIIAEMEAPFRRSQQDWLPKREPDPCNVDTPPVCPHCASARTFIVVAMICVGPTVVFVPGCDYEATPLNAWYRGLLRCPEWDRPKWEEGDFQLPCVSSESLIDRSQWTRPVNDPMRAAIFLAPGVE